MSSFNEFSRHFLRVTWQRVNLLLTSMTSRSNCDWIIIIIVIIIIMIKFCFWMRKERHLEVIRKECILSGKRDTKW